MCPPSEARCSGVWPSLSAIAGSAPFSSSSLTTSTCPFPEAQCSGVWPSLSAAAGSAPFSSSSFTTASTLKNAAKCSPVISFGNFWLYFVSNECLFLARNP
ncbi:hypothetical protein BKA61DRAFT_625628 [Leptodontidium sp. MPI-SDFR-AT-0119]|nr:hypothetical protein BKA61DRAFT_625628 [Leptodontidium sp. MPI-SDFR-AT-0119]